VWNYTYSPHAVYNEIILQVHVSFNLLLYRIKDQSNLPETGSLKNIHKFHSISLWIPNKGSNIIYAQIKCNIHTCCRRYATYLKGADAD